MACATPRSVLALSFQAGYACRHSGACCSAGWPIPVEPERAGIIRSSLLDGSLAAAGLPHPPLAELQAASTPALLPDPSGTCGFYDREARRCRIHRHLGPGALPVSCAHFPRRLLIEADRISVSLSHFCPTVAAMLFTGDGPVSIVEAPGLLNGIDAEGLDARDTWPPLLRPGVIAGHEAYRRWEGAVVELLAAAEGGPQAALDRAVAITEEVVRWQPGIGPLEEWVAASLAAGPRSAAPPQPTAWGAFEVPVGRYLAAKAFGSWAAYQAEGLSGVLAGVRHAIAVLGEEVERARARADAALDRPIFLEAVRQADLRVMHLAEP